ncbi:MAG TPA: efflux RND transporter permease subunit [Longimicrobium sp.]|jgi:HAE1 family hydrophobic/amphiphilic exporter-1|uniref:efflux RND transporter permease subunit n=1 Tax=Longimicrobium sp. TaxID=2029185 RepID=UPI002EDB4F68
MAEINVRGPGDGSEQEARKAPGGGLSGVAVRRPVFTAMMMFGLIVLGIFGFRRLPIDEFPDVDIPVVAVQTVYPGASPETIEREVTRRLEEAFNTTEGVDRITSNSLEGVSSVVVEFELERDGDLAAQDIRARIDQVRRDLPTEIEAPVVQKFDPSAQPILSLALSSGTLTVPELTTLADETIRRRLESVSGVGQVQIAGGLEREIRVNLLPERMQAVGVSAQDIMGALGRQNLEVPAGRVERGTGEQLVRVTGRITDPAQFNDVIVATRGGMTVRLSDVARVEDATEEERSLALVDDRRAVSLDVLKVSGANTVEVADGVKEAVAELEATLPQGAQLTMVRDNSINIRQSVDDVIHELLLGALLTVIVVMLFLNDWKATAITSLALPVSVISAFMLMDALGFTLNVLTLMGLSLSIGILVDDAIVVIENIVRHREHGEGYFTAARRGTSEIFLAVMATTLSIVAVFVPVAFMGGIIGRFFYQFGMTVAFAVLVSLFVSFTLTPMLAAWWGVDPHDPSAGGGNPLSRAIAGFNRWFDRGADRYRGIIGWALGHRKSTLGLAAAAFFGTFMLFPLIGGGFMPEQDQSSFNVSFETPEGSSLAYSAQKADEIGKALRSLPGVDFTYTTVGAGVTGTVTAGNVYVDLVPSAERDKSQQELMVDAREKLSSLFGATIAVVEAGGLGGPTQPLQVNLRGPEVTELARLSEQVAERMRAIPGIADVQTSLGAPRPEFRIDVNRDLANELGLDVGQVSGTVRPLLAGQTATTWEDPTGEERDVVVQLAPERRTSLESITNLPIATSGGATVPLGQVARVAEGVAPAQIDRQDLERVGSVGAGVTPELSIAEASTAITAALEDMQMPAGYTVTLGGETEQLQETMGFVLESILLAIILIFLILASQFESFTQPFAIMLSLPLSLIGVLLALLLTDDTFNMMSMIGVIMLMGLVTKNAILLVDNANERREAGTERMAALVEAGRVRLRPIVMTTMAMIFGMLPIAIGMGEGGGFRAPMARAVIGGLITSTLLTLVVVPVAYTYFDDFGGWVARGFKRKPKPAAAPAREPGHPGLNPEPTFGD